MEITIKALAAGITVVITFEIQSPHVEPLICVTWNEERSGTPITVERQKNNI